MIFALLAASAQAWGLEPVFDWTLSATAAPLGAETSFLPGVRQPRWDDPDNLLLSETYLQANGVVMITPAFTRAGIELAFQPAAVFELRARYAVVGYYGTFTAILPFADPAADYGPEAREGRPRTSGWGSFTSVQPTLRLKAGPVVLLASTAWRYGALTGLRCIYARTSTRSHNRFRGVEVGASAGKPGNLTITSLACLTLQWCIVAMSARVSRSFTASMLGW